MENKTLLEPFKRFFDTYPRFKGVKLYHIKDMRNPEFIRVRPEKWKTAISFSRDWFKKKGWAGK